VIDQSISRQRFARAGDVADVEAAAEKDAGIGEKMSRESCPKSRCS
jgi:hypothetical protein